MVFFGIINIIVCGFCIFLIIRDKLEIEVLKLICVIYSISMICLIISDLLGQIKG